MMMAIIALSDMDCLQCHKIVFSDEKVSQKACADNYNKKKKQPTKKRQNDPPEDRGIITRHHQRLGYKG